MAYWWDYVAKYPTETVIVVCVAIGVYWLYWELSKYWKQPLYTTKYGEWRILRYIGRLVELEDKEAFKKEMSKDQEFNGWIKISGQPKRRIILNRHDIVERRPNKIVMNKKYMYWNTEKSAYVLTDKRPKGYRANPQNLEKYLLTNIDNIDMKATRSARASPVVVHNSLLHQHLPLESGQYTEQEQDVFQYSDYIFDREELGGYFSHEELLEGDEDKRKRRKDKRPLKSREKDEDTFKEFKIGED